MKFSIIVPCYKCKNTINRVLDSVVKQNEDDLEVILVNDEEDFDLAKSVKKYSKKLNLKVINTEFKYHNPGNTRNYGIREAQGDWLIFIDCDDELREDALKWFSNAISSGDFTFVFGLMKQYHPDGTPFTEEEDYQSKHLVWLHGKCYNRKFIIDHNIYFTNTMKTCEDYYFNYQVVAHTKNEGKTFCDLNVFVYNWLWNDSSLSRSNTYVISIREHFYDHVEASLIPWVKILPNKEPQYAYEMYFMQLSIIYYLYQYFQSKGIIYKKDIVISSLSYIYECFGITILDLINSFEQDYESSQATYRLALGIIHENFVCQESFRTWLMKMM